MIQENRETQAKENLAFAFLSNSFAFVVPWVFLLFFIYHHWAQTNFFVRLLMISLAVSYPNPWIITLRARQNQKVLHAAGSAYIPLTFAVMALSCWA